MYGFSTSSSHSNAEQAASEIVYPKPLSAMESIKDFRVYTVSQLVATEDLSASSKPSRNYRYYTHTFPMSVCTAPININTAYQHAREDTYASKA